MVKWQEVVGKILFLFVIYSLLLLIGLCVSTRVFGAPVPTYKEPPVPQVTEGSWELLWAGHSTPVQLEPKGIYRSMWYGKLWIGTWRWDAKTRTLFVHECDKENHRWVIWHAVLDNHLQGKTSSEVSSIKIQMMKWTKKPLPQFSL